MSDTTPSNLPVDIDRLDTETARLGQLETDLMELLNMLARKHQELDEEFAPRVNSLLRETQDKFNSIRELAEATRLGILPKDKKSARRFTGHHAWRSTTLVDYVDSDEEIVSRIKAMGPRFYLKLLRTVPARVIDRNACKLSANEHLISQVEGISVRKGESYAVTPTGGFTMTTSRDLTKLEGLPLPAVLEAILREPEA